MSPTLRRSERLAKTAEIRAVLKFGRRMNVSDFAVRWLVRKDGESQPPKVRRLAVMIRKAHIKKANQRNRLRRLAREFFRLNKHRMKESLDIVIQIKSRKWFTFSELEKDLNRSFKELGILN